MNKIYLLADTHFGHTNLIESGEITEEQIGKCIESLNLIDPNDYLIHLGDVALSNEIIWNTKFKHYPFRKTLIRGNHDTKGFFWYITHGWDMVCDSLTINKYGYNLILTHTPKKHVKEGDVNICGHMHYKELHITNKISLPPLQLFELESLIELFKCRKYNLQPN
jgi:calcineurin-like phosphoesterase family protein